MLQKLLSWVWSWVLGLEQPSFSCTKRLKLWKRSTASQAIAKALQKWPQQETQQEQLTARQTINPHWMRRLPEKATSLLVVGPIFKKYIYSTLVYSLAQCTSSGKRVICVGRRKNKMWLLDDLRFFLVAESLCTSDLDVQALQTLFSNGWKP